MTRFKELFQCLIGYGAQLLQATVSNECVSVHVKSRILFTAIRNLNVLMG